MARNRKILPLIALLAIVAAPFAAPVLASTLQGILDVAGTHTYQGLLNAIAQYDVDQDHVVFRAPVALTVTKVTYVPRIANTAEATTAGSFTIKVINRTTAGVGTAQLGSTVDYATASDVASVPRTLYSSTTGTAFAAGDVMVIHSTITGIGGAAAFPVNEGLISVQFKPK